MAILIFEDRLAARLSPITLTRPAFAISCAGTRLVDQLSDLEGPLYLSVRPHLRDCVREDYPDANLWSGHIERDCLCVNARQAPTAANVNLLKTLLEGNADPTSSSNSTAFILPAGQTFDPAEVGDSEPSSDLELLQYPHDVIRCHGIHLADHIRHLVGGGEWDEIAPNVFAEQDVSVSNFVEFDTRSGPVAIRNRASIGSFATISGPVLIDQHAKVLSHAQIKDSVHIGRHCKVGGEVEASIIEPYSNKQHHGFLGHAYVGSWVNLGAGTSNSDLKNTYGQINVDYGEGKIATNMQFLGCVMGDYAKTAINTSIYTGKTIGTASMVYGTVTQNVASFVNSARDHDTESTISLEVATKMQGRMFGRRNVTQRESDIQLLRDVFQMTESSRSHLPTQPPTF